MSRIVVNKISAFHKILCRKLENDLKCKIGKMFLMRRFVVSALSETKLRGKGEVIFGEVVGRVSAWREAGRGKEWPCY